MARIRAILFDVDGTLLDSNDAHARAWCDALHGHGLQVPYELVRSKIGKGGDKLLMEVAGIDDESDQGKALKASRGKILKQSYYGGLGPTKGARELLLGLQALGFRCIAATSAGKDDLAPLLRAAGVADLLTEHVTSDDADASKPSPDIIEAALERVGLGPDEAIMIGDTPYDIIAAKRASVATIALRSGGWNDEDLKDAVAIYDDPADLLAHLEESPLGAGGSDVRPASGEAAAI